MAQSCDVMTEIFYLLRLGTSRDVDLLYASGSESLSKTRLLFTRTMVRGY